MSTLASIVRLAAAIVEGTPLDPEHVARTLVGAALDFAPIDELREYLSEEAARRAEAIADAAQAAKFGG